MTNKSILLIDDDDDFLRALTTRCESIGLAVEQTRNLLTATLKIAKHVPDIICTDVQMPTGNGLSFCQALASDQETSRVAIVVLTGKTDAETRHDCIRLNAKYVEKNVDYWSQLEPLLRRLASDTRATIPAPASSAVPQAPPKGPFPQVSRMELPAAGLPTTKKIVIADDDEDMVRMLSQRCASLGCSVVGVNNAFDAINEIRTLRPDLVCLDVSMPSGDGLGVCAMMAADDRLRGIPVMILTGRSDEATIRRCHDSLVYYVEKSANTWERVEPLVRELLHLDNSIKVAKLPPGEWPTAATVAAVGNPRDLHDLADAVFAALGAGTSANVEGAAADEVPWVLCIDDDADFSDALKIRLEDHGVAVLRAHTGMEGYRLAFTSPASAILLDFNMPDGQGDYILGRLKDNPVTRDIPVIIITGVKDKVLERRMLALGAAAFFVKPVSFDRLKEQLSRYISMVDVPEGLLITDKRTKKAHRIAQQVSKPAETLQKSI